MWRIIFGVILLAAVAAAGVFFIYLPVKYNTAVNHFNTGYYQLAAPEFESLQGYKDSEELANLSKYRYIQEHCSTEKSDLIYTYFESLEKDGYPMDEEIIKTIKQHKVQVYFSYKEKKTSNSKTLKRSVKSMFVNIDYISGYMNADMTVDLIITKGDREVAKIPGIVLKVGEVSYVELDAALREELGVGLIKASLYDSEGNFLCDRTTLITSE